MTRRGTVRGSRGYFGVGIYKPKTRENVGTLWRAAHLYGASFIFTIGHRYTRQASDTTKASASIPLQQFDDFTQFQAARPYDALLVGVELVERSVPLQRFTHPQRAVYLLGSEDNGLSREAMDACQHVIQIECFEAWSMNVAMAGSIVLYDRHVKAASARLSVAS